MCVTFLGLIDGISKDEGITLSRGQIGLLDCDCMGTIRIGNLCDDSFRRG
jgi:hypothetical protein